MRVIKAAVEVGLRVGEVWCSSCHEELLADQSPDPHFSWECLLRNSSGLGRAHVSDLLLQLLQEVEWKEDCAAGHQGLGDFGCHEGCRE